MWRNDVSLDIYRQARRSMVYLVGLLATVFGGIYITQKYEMSGGVFLLIFIWFAGTIRYIWNPRIEFQPYERPNYFKSRQEEVFWLTWQTVFLYAGVISFVVRQIYLPSFSSWWAVPFAGLAVYLIFVAYFTNFRVFGRVSDKSILLFTPGRLFARKAAGFVFALACGSVAYFYTSVLDLRVFLVFIAANMLFSFYEFWLYRRNFVPHKPPYYYGHVIEYLVWSGLTNGIVLIIIYINFYGLKLMTLSTSVFFVGFFALAAVQFVEHKIREWRREKYDPDGPILPFFR